jgi:hypothetical protein
MKIIAAVPFALLTLGIVGCSEHASTAPAVDRPAAGTTSSDTNTFGENKQEAAGSAASARAANYGSDPAPAADAGASSAAPAAGTGTAADSTAPK